MAVGEALGFVAIGFVLGVVTTVFVAIKYGKKN